MPEYSRKGFTMELPGSERVSEPASKMKFSFGVWMMIDWPAPMSRQVSISLLGDLLL